VEVAEIISLRGMTNLLEYRAGSLRAVAEEIAKFKSDLVAVQKVRWDGGGTEPADEYTYIFLWKGK
jgi:hypothetical protein